MTVAAVESDIDNLGVGFPKELPGFLEFQLCLPGLKGESELSAEKSGEMAETTAASACQILRTMLQELRFRQATDDFMKPPQGDRLFYVGLRKGFQLGPEKRRDQCQHLAPFQQAILARKGQGERTELFCNRVRGRQMTNLLCRRLR